MKRKRVSKAPSRLLRHYLAALLEAEGRMGTTGDPPEPYIHIEVYSKSHLEVVKRILEPEGWKCRYVGKGKRNTHSIYV